MSEIVNFQTNHTKCHLRGLCFQKPFVFVGIGSDLHVLKTDENGLNQLVFTKNIFKTLIINRIETFKNFETDSDIEIIVSICGNRFITIYKFLFNFNDNNCVFNQLLETHNFYDWILSVKITESLLFVVKAHNDVVIFDLKTKQMKHTIYETDKCILYSAELLSVSESEGSFVVSSGTVFKEIIIWTAFHTPTDSNQLIQQNLQRLRGHDGVIFALNYNQSLNILVSASDDRSIRIWTSSLDSNEFSDSSEYWSKNQFSLSHVFYGHSSRIWSVKTLVNPFPIVLSVGEDSSLYFWNINEKKLIQRVDGHKNSSIWSLSVDMESMIAYFGGSDSSLNSCDIFNTIKPFNSVVRHNIQPKQIKLILISCPHIFCSTISGDLILMSAKTDENVIKNSEFKKLFQSYSAIDVNKKRNQILLGSKSGSICLIGINQKCENQFDIQTKCILNSKVFSVCFVDSFNFMVCGIEGKIKVLSLKNFQQTNEFVLPDSRHRWTVSGILHKQLLIVGDRCGSVFVYTGDNQNPIKEFRHLHGSNGVTALKMKPNSSLMYSSGRNGKIFEFLIEDNSCSLLRAFRIFPDMEWIGNFEFDENTDEISYIYGFQSRDFVIWDERHQRFIETIDCGGGHRSWDFAVLENQYYFCYTKQDSIISFDKNLSKIRDSKLSLTKSSHSKKINCSSILFDKSSVYLATAGEENVIHINSLDFKTNDWRIEAYLFGHISNICAISCSPNHKESDSCFMVSVGGRAQLMFWKIDIKDSKLLCRQLFNKFLWPTDIIQNRCHKTSNYLSSSDPQIRYLDVNMTQTVDDKYLISTACSDSAFRLFIFNSNQLSFEMIGITSFNSSCVLKVFNILDSHIVIGSNDGTLRFWSFDQQLSEKLDSCEDQSNDINLNKLLEIRCHECGINALDVFVLNVNLWLLATGGDDNTLTISVIKSTEGSLNQLSFIKEKWIHSSQITGIKILSNNTILSAAIDQRVIVWKYNFDGQTLQLKLEPISTYISSIADISSISLSFDGKQNKWKSIVCGEGLQSLDIDIKTIKQQF